MHFEQYGAPRENLTERLKPVEKADEFIFVRLDAVLSMLRRKRPELLLPFVDRLTEHVTPSSASKQAFGDAELLAALTYSHPQLVERQELASRCLDVFLNALDLSGQDLRANAEVEVPMSSFQASGNRLDYAYYLALRDLVGRNKALGMFRDYVEHCINVHERPLVAGRGFATLAAMRRHRIWVAESGYCGRVRIVSSLENGMFIERCENCEKVEGLTGMEFENPDVFQTILCDSDFLVTRLLNPSFVLTRHKTIAGGHTYCDNAFHDIRIARTVEHPDDGFIARIHTMLDR
jgi:hypothetical protein